VAWLFLPERMHGNGALVEEVHYGEALAVVEEEDGDMGQD